MINGNNSTNLSEASKNCTKCGESKPLSEFYRTSKGKLGHTAACKVCTITAAENYRKDNLEKIRARDRDRYANDKEKFQAKAKRHYAKNAEQYKAANRANYQKKRDYYLAYAKTYALNNPEKIVNTKLKGSFGITLEQYNQILAIQNGVCAICRTATNGSRKRWAVEHDHASGRIRGLCCGACNSLLGFARDSRELLERAIAYLENPPAAAVLIDAPSVLKPNVPPATDAS